MYLDDDVRSTRRSPKGYLIMFAAVRRHARDMAGLSDVEIVGIYAEPPRLRSGVPFPDWDGSLSSCHRRGYDAGCWESHALRCFLLVSTCSLSSSSLRVSLPSHLFQSIVLHPLSMEESQLLPHTLLDLLSISCILNSIVPYLPLSSIFTLTRTSKSFRDLVLSSPDVFRYIDLSSCRGAYIPWISRIDTGGNTWRAQRMDENLTEDEFYAGPLRYVLGRLRRTQILKCVQSLVLDGLASVTSDLLHEIVTSPDYNVRLLSIRRCVNVNEAKLQQLLTYICRPSRPEGTPRLQGVYFFTDPIRHLPSKQNLGVTTTEGAQIGAAPLEKATATTMSDYWYAPLGQLLVRGHKVPTSWEQTLNTCKGIIWFDAILCTHMHADMESVAHKDSPEFSAMATIALGPEGCSGCGSGPKDVPVWGQSDLKEFPLLWPPPHSSKLIDAVRPPPRQPAQDGKPRPQRLIVSCSWCMDNRHCESCHRWWCADCYDLKRNKNFQTLEHLREAGVDEYLSGRELSITQHLDQTMKVFNGLCVSNCLVGEWMAGAGGGGMWG